MLLNTRAVNLLDTTQATSDGSNGRPRGASRRTAINSSGNLYFVMRTVADNNLRVIKQTGSGLAAPTTFSGAGQHTTLTSTTLQAMIACDMGPDDVLHIVFLTDTGATKALKHVRFDTTTDGWLAEETIQTGVGVATLAGPESLDIWVDSSSVPHVVWNNQITAGPTYRLYYSTRTAGVWTTPETVSNLTTTAPLYVPRVHVDDSGRVLVLNWDVNWKGWETPGAWAATTLLGYGQADINHTSDNVRHILFCADKRHTTVAGPLSTAASTLGAIKFEHPIADGGARGVSGDNVRILGYGLAARGRDLYLFAGARGRLFQGMYKAGAWSTLREVSTVLEDSQRVDTLLTHTPKKPIDANSLWGVFKIDRSTGTANLTAVNPSWFISTMNTSSPPRGGVTHDLVIDDTGYMLEGALQKADISQALPRVTIATEQRKEENISDLSSFTQSSWHHGRGEREFANPLAFFDSDGMLTHIPDQLTPPLYYVALTPFDGHPVDGILYQGNFYVLVKGSAAANNGAQNFANNSLRVFNNTTSAWDAVAAGLDTVNATPGDLEIYNEDLWVAQGDTDNCRVYDFSTTTWVDGGQPAYCLKEWDGKLWRADNINEIYYSSNADLLGSATWTLLGTVDDGAGTTSRIRGFETYAGTLLIFADMGVYQVLSNGDSYQLLPLLDDSPQRKSTNGQARAVFGGVLFYNVEEGVVRFDGSTRQEVGPNRSPLSSEKYAPLTTLKRGIPSSMVATDTLLYMTINPDTPTTGRGTVMVNSGTGWHEFFKSPDPGYRMNWVFFTPKLATTGVLSHRTLWVNSGQLVYYIRLPDTSENPVKDTGVDYDINNADFYLITPWLDRGMPALPKVEQEIILRCDNLGTATSANHWVDVYFQTEEGIDSFTVTDWTKLHTFYVSPVDTFRITEKTAGSLITPSGAAGGLVYTRIRYLLRLSASDATNATVPVIRSFSQRFAIRPQPRYGFTSVAKCYDELTRLDGEHENGQGDELRRALYALQLQSGPHYVDDGTLIPVINTVLNPSFEADSNSDGLCDNWVELDTVNTTTVRSSKHVRTGTRSQKVTVADAATAAAGIEQTITAPVGVAVRVGASIYVEEGSGVVLQLYDVTNSVVIQQSNPVWTLSGHGSPLKFSNVTFEVSADDLLASLGSLKIRIVVPDELAVSSASYGSSIFYVDDVFTYFGDDPPEYYIDGSLNRCQWIRSAGFNMTSLPDMHSTQRRTYSVYLTGLNESFRHRKGAGKLDSQVTVMLREAAG